MDITPVVKGFLEGDEDEDDITAATDALTTLAGDWSDSESDDNDDGEDFALENAPRPPPAELMYGGQGKCETPTCAVKMPNASHQTTARKRKRRDARGGSTRNQRRPRRHVRLVAPEASDLPDSGGSGETGFPGTGTAVDQGPCSMAGNPVATEESDLPTSGGSG